MDLSYQSPLNSQAEPEQKKIIVMSLDIDGCFFPSLNSHDKEKFFLVEDRLAGWQTGKKENTRHIPIEHIKEKNEPLIAFIEDKKEKADIVIMCGSARQSG